MIRYQAIILVFLGFSPLTKSEELPCHFDLETDELGTPYCEEGECIFRIEFPNYENMRIRSASMMYKQGTNFIKAELAVEKIEEKGYSTISFSEVDSTIILEVQYDLGSCVMSTKYQIESGDVKQIL